uniref:Uncharacterized protein n=1 Tax=Rhizophora mucronata TaxID=61149 RepID=A0A2P2QRY1_RHIMU
MKVSNPSACLPALPLVVMSCHEAAQCPFSTSYPTDSGLG